VLRCPAKINNHASCTRGVELHVKCSFLLSDFNERWNVSTNVCKTLQDTAPWELQLLYTLRRQTDGHGEATGSTLQHFVLMNPNAHLISMISPLASEQNLHFSRCPVTKHSYVICDIRGSHGGDDMTPCTLVEVFRHFGGTNCLHFQGRRESQASKKRAKRDRGG
jgi:hypothetical protein